MSSDTSTPIFVALNEELGELPDIDVHDFDAHGFDFGARPPEAKADGDASAAGSGGRRRRHKD